MIKGKTLKLSINNEEYNVISNPLESLQNLVKTLIIIISAVSIGILALLLTIWTRGRAKEIGILMSFGISKQKIVGQFMLETVLIAVLAFGFSYPISNAVAEKSSDFIMTQVTDSQNLSEDNSPQFDGSFDTSDFDMLSETSAKNAVTEIDVTVSTGYLIWVYVIGILLTICAVLLASYTVIRLKPRAILSKMS
jgi:putative ABC transport system permease protein